MGLKVGDECGAVQIALFGLAQAVDLQLYAANAQFFPQRVSHQDEFGIQLGAAKAQRLGAHLVELAVAPALGPLVAEHGAKVIQALAAVVEERVFDHRAHHTGGVFGAQGELLAVEPVLERIHLFLNNVGHLAQAAHKQRGGLDDGGADVFISVAAHQRAHPLFERFPPGRVGRQYVVHAFDGQEFFRLAWRVRFGHKRGQVGDCVAAAPKRCWM